MLKRRAHGAGLQILAPVCYSNAQLFQYPTLASLVASGRKGNEDKMKNNKFSMARLLSLGIFVFCVMALAPQGALAQQATAQVTGKVHDASGAIVVGAHLKLTNSQTGVSKTTTSNKDGDYLFTLVPIGTYDLSVTQKGFQTYQQKGITLDINQNAKIDVPLQVGSTTETVEVNANATQVDTQSATLGKVETE